MRGRGTRGHSTRVRRAGIGAVAASMPGGRERARSRRPFQVTAYAVSSTLPRAASDSSSWAVTCPTPVRTPSSDVASSATRRPVGPGTGSDLERFVLDLLHAVVEALVRHTGAHPLH